MTRLISFYLPQFHPIPENDAWWGPGFTEWTNVARARPRFPGHHQPHLPADLGFYDLRLEESRVAQAELAAEYGIGAFCYYHYWFNGKLLLQRPLEEMVRSGRPDFPFCICWANENWTRRWDGRDREVLIGQDYDGYDPDRHMEWMLPALADERYVTVGARPLLLVYRTDQVPDFARVADRWRERATRAGLPEPYLCGVSGPGHAWTVDDFFDRGLDGVVDFHPKGSDPLAAPAATRAWAVRNLLVRVGRRLRTELLSPVRSRLHVQSYAELMEAAIRTRDERTMPCVIPGWDNSARRRHGAVVIQNDDPDLYRRWLEHAIRAVSPRPPEERIVFVNAWNEWAEGCHLEPDLRHGRAFLEATRAALDAAGSADGGAHPHAPPRHDSVPASS